MAFFFFASVQKPLILLHLVKFSVSLMSRTAKLLSLNVMTLNISEIIFNILFTTLIKRYFLH